MEDVTFPETEQCSFDQTSEPAVFSPPHTRPQGEAYSFGQPSQPTQTQLDARRENNSSIDRFLDEVINHPDTDGDVEMRGTVQPKSNGPVVELNKPGGLATARAAKVPGHKPSPEPSIDSGSIHRRTLGTGSHPPVCDSATSNPPS